MNFNPLQYLLVRLRIIQQCIPPYQAIYLTLWNQCMHEILIFLTVLHFMELIT